MQSDLQVNRFQPFRHLPKRVTPVDGAPEFPPNLKTLIREYCGKEQTRQLPCARARSARAPNALSRNGIPFRFEDTVTGTVLAVSGYEYGQDHILMVVRGGYEPAIINYMAGADGENSTRKLYSVWKGIHGWETPPSVAKIFGKETSYPGATTPTNMSSLKPLLPLTYGNSTLGVSQRQAGKEAEEKIRSSLKRQRHSYELESETDEDDHGGLSSEAMIAALVLMLPDASLTHRTPTKRPSHIERPTIHSNSSVTSADSILIASGTASNIVPSGSTAVTGTTTLTHNSSPPTHRHPSTAPFELEIARLTIHEQAHTTFVFKATEKAVPRVVKFAECDDIAKFFNHARTAKLFQTWAEVVPLSCRVNNAAEEICVMKDMAEDFDHIVIAIKADACWKQEPAECVVSVVIAE